MTIQIARGIPLPPVIPAGHRGGRAPKYPFTLLEPGDSFFVAPEAGGSVDAIRNTLSSAVCRIKKMNPGSNYSCRLWTENGVSGIRVWRTA
jgi:hypothetical protein